MRIPRKRDTRFGGHPFLPKTHFFNGLLHNPHLHCVNDLFPDQNGSDNHDGHAGPQSARFEQHLDCSFNCVLWIDQIKRYYDWRYTPIERHGRSDRIARTEGVNLGITRAHPTDVARHVASPRKHENGFGLQFVGHHDSAFAELLARRFQSRVL